MIFIYIPKVQITILLGIELDHGAEAAFVPFQILTLTTAQEIFTGSLTTSYQHAWTMNIFSSQ